MMMMRAVETAEAGRKTNEENVLIFSRMARRAFPESDFCVKS